MRTRITTFILAALTALAMMAAPAAAHPHAKAANGSIGPALDGSNQGAIAHNGIECAVANNPNLTTSLTGPPLFLECPAPNK